jgi:hypothetical protein
MKCLNCKYIEIIEHGAKGFLGETILECRICNEIKGDMEKCEDFQIKDEYSVLLSKFCNTNRVTLADIDIDFKKGD